MAQKVFTHRIIEDGRIIAHAESLTQAFNKMSRAVRDRVDRQHRSPHGIDMRIVLIESGRESAHYVYGATRAAMMLLADRGRVY